MIGCFGSVICHDSKDVVCRKCPSTNECAKMAQSRLVAFQKEANISKFHKKIAVVAPPQTHAFSAQQIHKMLKAAKTLAVSSKPDDRLKATKFAKAAKAMIARVK